MNSHPLKWLDLVDTVKESKMGNPDIWIEDITDCGPCTPVVRKSYGLDTSDSTEAVEASFSVLRDKKNNRIVIRHHF